MMKKGVIALALGAALSASAQVTELMNATLWQDPQTKVVEITYDLAGRAPGYYITLGIETNGVPVIVPLTVTGDVTTPWDVKAVAPGNGRKIHWKAWKDWPGHLTLDARAVVIAGFTDEPPVNYLPLANPVHVVVDLSGGPSAPVYPVRYSAAPPDISDPACKTSELWLRRIPKGTFMMGSPPVELGDYPNEWYHQTTLTKDFYIGIFEVTQRQWELVTGGTPSAYPGDTRPVEKVSYDDIRGSDQGTNWPASASVDPTSFMGLLRAKTALTFDLPTEAQWEFACRAGKGTSLNSGKNITATTGTCPNMAEVGRYLGNTSDNKGGHPYAEHTSVGLYAPNALGLYDMHGNVFEWCLDWYLQRLGEDPVTDPAGPASGASRMIRGGAFDCEPRDCRSAFRNAGTLPPASLSGSIGFRACILP